MRFHLDTPQGKSWFFHDNNDNTIRNPGGYNETDDINYVVLGNDDFDGVFWRFAVLRGVVVNGEHKRTVVRIGLEDQTREERRGYFSNLSYVYLDNEEQEKRFKDTARIRDNCFIEWNIDSKWERSSKDEILIHFDELYRATGAWRSNIWTSWMRAQT